MKTKHWILILCTLFVLFSVLSIRFLLPKERCGYAEIWSEGTLLKTVKLQVDQTFLVESSHGTNTVAVQNGKISVIQASCPDHYCMKRGECDRGADIICLPNQLVIKFTDPPELDATVG